MSIVHSVVFGRMLAALACICASAKLAIDGKDGWGWFLFGAIVLGSITASSGDKKLEVE